MEAKISLLDSADEYYFAEGCHITELSNSAADTNVSIARARVEPGVTTRWHRLIDIEERYVIVSGYGRMELGTLAPQQVGPGDVVLIPPHTRQRIHNSGDVDLIFLAICSPRFRADAYQDMEEDELPANEVAT